MYLKSMFALIIVMTIGVGMILTSCSEYSEGSEYHGFKLIEKRFVKEVNAECMYFEHVKSGARLFKIVADDPNKTFGITFKTDPETDYGTPHIMEHSVLNGSKNFPVKSPFDILSKGSLNTFLNAMTGSDFTMYPIASMNTKDYFNLMHVYLDAVFNPLIYDDPRILKQEGWHHEMTETDGPVTYKGVVYNEMKGSFSSPTRELNYQMYKHLFPDNGYGKESGGYPTEIPKLTYDYFINYHKRYYHPANSYIYLYGDANLNQELKFIDEAYLKNYDVADVRAKFPLQKPFESMKEVSGFYSVPKEANTTNQTYLNLAFVAGLNTDRSLYMAFDILTDVLVNHESGPIRLALEEAGIGKDVYASIHGVKQNVVEFRVQNANPADKDKFYEIVMSTLRKSAEDGLDKKIIEGILNRMEFRLREGNDAQKGMTYIYRARTGWLFADDPFLGLEYENPLAKVKTALTTNYLESVIKEYLLDNPHSLLLSLEPKPGLTQVVDKKVNAELAAYGKSLSDGERESLVKETKELVEYQKQEDSPESVATIPLLDLADISKEIEWYPTTEKNVSGTPVIFHNQFTNRIVYINLYFDARVIPQELIPYAAMLTELLGSLNTENYSFGELDNALNIHTGGFNTGISAYLENEDDSKMIPKFVVASKATFDKVDKLFELNAEILTKTIFDDNERLKSVLQRHQSRLESQVKRDGFTYSRTRLNSYFSNNGMFNELKGGFEYYWFITDLSQNFDKKADDIKDKLTQTASLLFTKDNMIAGANCDDSDLPVFNKGIDRFIKSLAEGKAEIQNWQFDLKNKNEGFLAASKVQYVMKGYDFKKLGYEYNGKMRVLGRIISSDWLHNQIRVIGGAYGGFSILRSNGPFYFGSYRDPNLATTLENFDATTGFLEKFEADEKEMTRFIIGTISRMDRPLTPSQKGDVAFQRHFEKTTAEELKKERDDVLITTPEDIRNYTKMISDMMAQNAICVYGNEEKIKQDKDQFGRILELTPEM